MEKRRGERRDRKGGTCAPIIAPPSVVSGRRVSPSGERGRPLLKQGDQTRRQEGESVMRQGGGMYRVFVDETIRPRMYGIQSRGGQRVGRISTDLQEVSRLAECCNSAGLSPIHLADVVEDFRRS